MPQAAHKSLWIKPYYRCFDGLRAVAVILVFLIHYAIFFGSDPLDFSQWGWIGVDLFFVLSGFLITGILYDTVDLPHFFKDFYIRRALRIFPLFYGFFALVFLLRPLLHLQWDRSLASFVFYIGNLVTAHANLAVSNPTIIQVAKPGTQPHEILNIGHLWSLCVEEQFYLVWPAVVWLVRDRRKLLRLSVALIVATLLLRCGLRVHLNPKMDHYPLLFVWSTYTRFDTLLWGACLALWLRGNEISRHTLRRTAHCLFFTALPVFFIGFAWSMHRHPDTLFLTDGFVDTVGFTLLGIAASGVVLRSLDETGWLARFLQIPPLQWLGKRSYGFYFLHSFPLVFLKRITEVHPKLGLPVALAGFVLTSAAAAISFKFYETPFLRLKARWAPTH